jgi:hypothetical protein
VERLKEIYKIDKSMKANQIVDLKCEVTQLNTQEFTVTLDDVEYVPNLCVNLFIVKKALKEGFQIINNGVIICLKYKHV